VIFSELRFVALVIACWTTFALAPRAARPYVLVGGGLAFYALFARPYFPFIVVLIALTYVLAAGRLEWLAALTVVAAFLAVKGRGEAPGFLQLAPGTRQTGVLAPLGFSFLALELVHYLVDRRRGRIGAVRLVDFASYCLFFPCRVAGPIRRYREFVEAVAAAVVTPSTLYHGTVRILIGILKKVAIADLAGQATQVSPTTITTTYQAWKMVLAYSVQIYVEFSAYCDIAPGIAILVGIVVPENFRSPYLSRNVQEFWTRWHITFSSWLRDYVFMEAGRRLFKTGMRRQPQLIAAIAYLLTFAVGGLWHALTANFLVWGLYHGALLAGYHVYRSWIPMSVVRHPWFSSRPATVASVALTMFAVMVGWVFFMTDLATAARMLRLLVDLAIGAGLAALIVACLLLSAFNSTFIYAGF
jgi:alginate O-acetyltransferase complex protein AlgI